MGNLMHTQSTWMTCDCSANKHWVHVYYVPQKNDFLTGQCWHCNDLWLGRRLCSINKQWASLSLSTHTHTHTHLGRMTCDCAVSTMSAHVPEKNDLWLCSINNQWVHKDLRRMTCDSVVSTISECICTWEEWLVTGQCQHGETQPHWPSYTRKGTDSQHGAVYVVALSVGHMGWCTLGGDQSESVHEWKQCKITHSHPPLLARFPNIWGCTSGVYIPYISTHARWELP